MAKKSAGLLMYRWNHGELEVFLVHPGGPFWAKKDVGSWSIPKGAHGLEEEPLEVAKREFQEETSFEPSGEYISLAPRKQPSGKIITVWAFPGDCDAAKTKSNTFLLEWPPHSGRQEEFPEVDRGGWFSIPEAKGKITKGQIGFLDELSKKLLMEIKPGKEKDELDPS